MEWYYVLLIIILSLFFLYLIVYISLGLYVYNKMMVCKKAFKFEDIKEDSHWYCFKEELIKRQTEYFEYEKNASKHTIVNKRNIKLSSYLIKQDTNKTPRLVLFFHGYKATHAIDVCYCDMWMLKKGYDCMLVDQEGLGESEGKRMGFGIIDSENALEWIDYVNELYNHNVNIILCGVSMGASTVLYNACKEMENVKCIIADCGFTSMYDEMLYLLNGNRIFTSMIRGFLKIFWKRDIKLSTITSLNHSLYPVLFIHGKLDRFVPCNHTIKNYEACTSYKDILLVDMALHAESGLVESEKYKEKIDIFIQNVLKQ
ncbi:MAG: alpha/beta hydrolase [Bacilli bacterium]|nr:alpha/beta hydrolase [Bacilli bacterium]